MPIKGLDELSKKAVISVRMQASLPKLNQASLTEILTPEFVSSHTTFGNADELFKASGFDVSSQASFEAIPEDKLDVFISSVSKFTSWRELLNAAGAEWSEAKVRF